jgi:uncharacterized protein (DUF2267 family)/rhodanese-related sulfurtransferase
MPPQLGPELTAFANDPVLRKVEHDVEQTAELPAHASADAAIAAVMCVLTERLTAGEAHRLLGALPEPIRPVFKLCVQHRDAEPVQRRSRKELLEDVAEHLDVTPAHAERICAAVFAAVQDELPPRVVDDVTHQLPRGLRDLWRALPTDLPHPSPETGGAAPADADVDDDAWGPRTLRSELPPLGAVLSLDRDEVAAAIERGEAQVLNVLERPPVGRLRLVPGSRHLPLSELHDHMGELDPGREVIVYCSDPTCDAGAATAEMLVHHGFQVRKYEGGLEDWMGDGRATVAA